MVYYNEIDSYAAEWLCRLILMGEIAHGIVDERPIQNVKASDLKGFQQCHFFAGIGVWSYALRIAGWPDDREVWTGSCPCQPFSAAGKGEGTADARHLWPEWFRLIGECRPVAIFGEQVSAAIRHSWLDLVQADLEGLDYAVGAAVVGAHSVGAPHIRQRLYFVADSNGQRRDGEQVRLQPREARQAGAEVAGGGRTSGLADAGQEQRGRSLSGADRGRNGADQCSARSPSATNGFWRDAEWLPCIDGKARPVEPKYVAVVDGVAGGMGFVRAGAEAAGWPTPTKGLGGGKGDGTNKHGLDLWEAVKRIDDAPQDNRNGGTEVRTVQQDGEAACPPQGREPEQQRPFELADFVRLLPQSFALAKLHGDTATTEALLALLEASGAQRLVQYPSHQVEATWRPLGEEAQDRFRRRLADGPRFVRTVEHPLAHGAPGRVGKLRAYGNAICAETAAEFVRAYQEVKLLGLDLV